MSITVHHFEPHPTDADLCRHCPAPEGNRRYHDIARADLKDPFELPEDLTLIDTGIRRCLANLDEWSANDMQDLLSRVVNRNAIGKRFGDWRKRRQIEHTGRYVPSSNGAAKGHDVKVYRAGPNWPGSPAEQGK